MRAPASIRMPRACVHPLRHNLITGWIVFAGRASSQTEKKKRSASLKDGEEDPMILARWLTRQSRKMYAFNAVLVLANLGLMVGGRWMVQVIGFLPSIAPSWSFLPTGAQSFFGGSMELYLIFSFAWLLQQIIGLLYRTLRSLRIGSLALTRIASRITVALCQCSYLRCASTLRNRAYRSLWSQDRAGERRTFRVVYDELCNHLDALHIAEYQVPLPHPPNHHTAPHHTTPHHPLTPHSHTAAARVRPATRRGGAAGQSQPPQSRRSK